MRLCRVYRESFKESTIKLSKHLMTLTSFTDILLFLNIIDWQNFVWDTRINRLGVEGTWTLQSCIFYRALKPGPTISKDSFTILPFVLFLWLIFSKSCVLIFVQISCTFLFFFKPKFETSTQGHNHMTTSGVRTIDNDYRLGLNQNPIQISLPFEIKCFFFFRMIWNRM